MFSARLSAGFLCVSLFLTMYTNAFADMTSSQRSASRLFNDYASIFEAADDYSTRILEQCPPGDCVVLSLGLTSTLVESFLRVKLAKMGVTDESYLQHAPIGRFTRINGMSKQDAARVFETIFPEPSVKSVLILRTLFATWTLTTVLFCLRDWLNKTGRTTSLTGFFVVNDKDLIPSLRQDLETAGVVNPVIEVNYNYFDVFARRSLDDKKDAFFGPFEYFNRYSMSVLPKNPSPQEMENWLEKIYSPTKRHQELDSVVTNYLTKSVPVIDSPFPDNVETQESLEIIEEQIQMPGLIGMLYKDLSRCIRALVRRAGRSFQTTSP